MNIAKQDIYATEGGRRFLAVAKGHPVPEQYEHLLAGSTPAEPEAGADAPAEEPEAAPAEETKPKRRSRSKKATPPEETPAEPEAGADAEA